MAKIPGIALFAVGLVVMVTSAIIGWKQMILFLTIGTIMFAVGVVRFITERKDKSARNYYQHRKEVYEQQLPLRRALAGDPEDRLCRRCSMPLAHTDRFCRNCGMRA